MSAIFVAGTIPAAKISAAMSDPWRFSREFMASTQLFATGRFPASRKRLSEHSKKPGVAGVPFALRFYTAWNDSGGLEWFSV
jgi:hypothetical protein